MSEIAPFPSDFASKSKKESVQYGMAVSNAIMYRLDSSRGLFDSAAGDMFSELMLYLAGNQPQEPYKLMYRGVGKNGGARKGYNNINFGISSPAPTYRSTLHKLLSDFDFMVEVGSLSRDAINEKILRKYRLWYETRANSTIEEINKELGISIPLKTSYFVPQTMDELEQADKNGYFKMQFERGLTKIGEDVLNTSDWEYVSQNLKDELLKTSYMVAVLFDRPNGSTGVKYIQTKDYNCSYSQDSRVDPAWEGHYEYESLECLLPRLKASYPNITEDEIRKIAYLNINQNKGYNEYNYTTPDPVTSRFAYYDFQIKVFKFVYKSVDVSHYVKKEKEGAVKFHEEEYVAPKLTENSTLYKDMTYYEGTRIVGCEYIVDYGKMKNMFYNSDGTPCSPYIRETTGELSIVQRWRPKLDNYQMAELKYRTFLAAMKGDRTVYDVGILSNMDFGQGKMTQSETVRYSSETGDLYVATRGDMLGKIDVKNAVIEIPAINAAINQVLVQKDFIEKEIRQIAGITEAVSASSTPGSEKLVGVTMQEVQATNNAIYTLAKTFMRMKIRIVRKAVSKTRVKLEYLPKTREYYEGVLGKEIVDEILIFKDLSLDSIGTTFRQKANPTMKQTIYQVILESMKAGKNGQVGISPSAGAAAIKELEEGYPDQAIWMVALEEQRMARRFNEERKQASIETGQIQQQSAEATAAFNERLLKVESLLRETEKAKEIVQQAQADIQVDDNKSSNTLKEIALKETLSNKNDNNGNSSTNT